MKNSKEEFLKIIIDLKNEHMQATTDLQSQIHTLEKQNQVNLIRIF